jgi:hypothetical protein
MIEQESNNLKESRKEGVLNEHLDSKLDLVLEGFSALDKKIDDNHEEFREFASDVKFNFGVVFGNLRELRQFQVDANLKFDVVFEELHEINGRLGGIENRLDGVEEKVGISS